MDTLEKCFNLAGSLICHQLPSRSLYADNIRLPVCARDMGIYIGIFTAAVLLLLLRRLKAQKPPSTLLSIFMCLFMLPMVLDGFLSYVGIINTNNITRLFTGVLFGIPIPFFLVPAAHYSIYGKNDKAVLKSAAELLIAYIIAIVLCILLLKGLIPYVAASSVFVFGLLFLLSRLIYTVFVRMDHFKKKLLYAVTCCTTLFMLIFLFLVSTFVLQPLKAALMGG